MTAREYFNEKIKEYPGKEELITAWWEHMNGDTVTGESGYTIEDYFIEVVNCARAYGKPPEARQKSIMVI